MRIGLVYPHMDLGPDSPPKDALAVVVLETGRRLARTERVTAFGRREPGRPGLETFEGMTLRRYLPWTDRVLGQMKRLDGVVFRDPLRPFRTTKLYCWDFGRKLRGELRRAELDVVHVHAVPNLLPGIRSTLPNARIVFHAHDHRIADFDPRRMRDLLAHADHVLSCSGFVSRAISDRFPDLEPRCSVLHNGADEAFFAGSEHPRAPGPDALRILFVGRLSPEKGVHSLIEAFAAIADRHPEATLDLVGPAEIAPFQFVDPFGKDPRLTSLEGWYTHRGAYAHHLRRMIPEGLGRRVRFLGAIANARLPDLYRGATVFAFPSIWDEPFGMPVVEAMAAGLPVVATRVGAFPETVVDGETGLLVPPGDPPGLAAALDALLSDPTSRAGMGAAGRARAERHFTWESIVGRLLDLYREARPARKDT